MRLDFHKHYQSLKLFNKSFFIKLIIFIIIIMQNIVCESDIYKKIRLLGQGANGKAYLVECSLDKNYYVMKRIQTQFMQQQQKQKVINQAFLLQSLKHPNIIGFKEIYKTKKGKVCIIMQYANGGDLATKIQKQNGKFFQQKQIIDWLTQLCFALKYIHQRKIIHRDIKTQNIFLTTQNKIKIGDFGVARVLNKTEQNVKTFIGTPYYLSPQLVQGKYYNDKIDIWALGVVLYELCSLKQPFQAKSLPMMALKILKSNIHPIPNNYSKELKALVNLLLKKDLKIRPEINEVLRYPLINKRIKQIINKVELNYELETQKKSVELLAKKGIQKEMAVNNTKKISKAYKKKITIEKKQKKEVIKKENKFETKEQQKIKKIQQRKQREKNRQNQRKIMKQDIQKKRQQTKGKQEQEIIGNLRKQEKNQQRQVLINKSKINLQKEQKEIKKVEKTKQIHQKIIKQKQQSIDINKPWKNKNKFNSEPTVEIYLPQDRIIQKTQQKIQIKKSKIRDIPVQFYMHQIKKQEKSQPKQIQQKENIQKNVQYLKQQQKRQNQNTINQNKQQQVQIKQQQQLLQQQKQQQENYNQNFQQYDQNKQNSKLKESQINQKMDDIYHNLKNEINDLNLVFQNNQILKNVKEFQEYMDQQEDFDKCDFKQTIVLDQLQQKTIGYITNINRRQQLRLLLNEKLGQQNFIKAYQIIKQVYQKDQEFHKQKIGENIKFIQKQLLDKYSVLIFTLVVLQSKKIEEED